MNSPRISVIMSAYNCQDFVGKAIESILGQTFTDFEFLIADDGSTDETKNEILKFRDSRIIVIENKQNIGLLETWNNLFLKTSGEYVTWQDADDISYPNRLEKLLFFMENNRDYAFCGSNFSRPFPNFKKTFFSNYPCSNDEIKDYISSRQDLPFCGLRLLFRKDILGEFFPLRSFFKGLGWEDLDLLLRIQEKHMVANIPDVLYQYNYYPNSSSKSKIQNLNYKKFYITQIGFFLFEQRKRLGQDVIESKFKEDSIQLKEFDEYLNKLKATFESEPILHFNRIIKNQIANKDFKNAWISYRFTLKNLGLSIGVIDLFFTLVTRQIEAYLGLLFSYRT